MNWHWGGFVGGLIGTTVISPPLAVVAVNCWERWRLASARRKAQRRWQYRGRSE